MAKKNNPHNYSPELMEPIVLPTLLGAMLRIPTAELSPEALKQEDKNFILQQHLYKLLLLYKHYDVDPANLNEKTCTELILKMAQNHIPGFQVYAEPPNKVGQPNKWKGWEGLQLYIDVQKDFREHNHRSVVKACERLIKTPRYKALDIKNGKSLYNRYAELKKSNRIVSSFMSIPDKAKQKQIIEAFIKASD